MSITKDKLNKVVDAIKNEAVIDRISKFDTEVTKKIQGINMRHPFSKEGVAGRMKYIRENLGHQLPYLAGDKKFEDNDMLKGNIENYIGMTQLPTGVFGPLVINGVNASGAFYIPLATSEGALVASYARGAKACKDAGAIGSECIME
jgi:hydroxymethylglutaryl-CoA reductase (NADPH)